MLDIVPNPDSFAAPAAAEHTSLRRVVVIADFGLSKGGAENVAIDSARALAESGLDVSFIFAVGTLADDRLSHPRIKATGLGFPDLWAMPRLIGAQAGIWHREAARRLAGELARLPIDGTVVHLHQWTRSFSPAIFKGLVSTRRPLAVTMHGYYIACPTGILYRYDTQQVCDLKPGSLACTFANCDPLSPFHKAIRVARTWATHHALAGAAFDAIHVSDRGQASLGPYLPADVRQHRIDNPVRVVSGPPAEIAEGSAFAFIGRMTPEKGAERMAAAAKAAGVPALFVGEGPSEAAIRRINPDARLLGWRSSAEVMALLRREIRCVVAPSLWPETGPLTVYEALAAGVPVIASNRAGASEKVTHGETGFVCEPTVDGMAAAMRQLACRDTARHMGRTGYERYWLRPLSAQAHAAALVRVYRRMLAERPVAAGVVAASRIVQPA